MVGGHAGRRGLLLGVLAAGAAGAQPREAWPTRSIRIVVPFAPGGGNDILARLYGQHMGARLGQTFLAENRPGASGAVGTEQVVRARPDGYTLVVHPSGPVLGNPGSDGSAYDLARDLVPVAILATFPTIISVAPNSPHRTLGELIAWARANPGRGTYGTGGLTFQIWMAALGLRTEAKFETVMYRGSVDALSAAAAGDTTMAVADPGPSRPALEGGRVRALVVTTRERLPWLPDVPTIGEAGYPELATLAWIGLFAPAGTPGEIVARLEAAVGEAAALPEVRDRLAPLGMTPDPMPREAFARLIVAEAERWREVARASGLSLTR